jgi:hypothetical protein
MTKKLLLIIGIITALLAPVLIGSPAFAIDILNGSGGDSGPCNNPDATGSNTPAICNDNAANSTDNPLFGPDGILTVSIKIISLIIGIMAIIMMIVNAIKLVTSGGDPKAVASGRDGIIYALIGLLVAVIAQLLVAFVLTEV